MFRMSYRDIEDARLYQGGCQIERYELCNICGDDVDEKGKMIDGMWYCSCCFDREMRRIRNAIRPAINMATKPNPFERAALVACLKDFVEDLDDSD